MQNWEYKKLGDVCEVLNGYAFKSAQYVEEGIRVIRITNVQNGYIVDDEPKFYPLEKEKILSDYMLNDGDLLISLTGNCGRVGILTEDFLPAALNQRVACLRLKDDSILKSYLFHILNTKSFEIKCMDEATGAAQKNMSTEWLKKQEFVFPPLEEQKRIVKILDVKFAQLETVKANAKANLQNAKDLFQSQLTKAFSNTTWEKKRLGDVSTVTSSKRVYAEEQTKDGIPFLRVSDLVSRINGVETNDLYISEEKYGDFLLKGLVPKVDDLLITSRGTLGLCYIVKETDRFYFQDGMITWISLKEKLNSKFIAYLFATTELKNQIKEKAGGAAVSYISISDIRQLEIPLPPLPEQKRIVEQLDSLSEKVRSLEEIYTKQLANCDELKQAFLKKAFDGEL